MLRNYLLVSWRNIFRHFSVSFLNILGLSTGLACSLLIYIWIADELSYDRFHRNAERIYRVEEDQNYSNGIYHVTVTPWPAGPVWKEMIPEIEEACRITSPGSILVRYKDNFFYEDRISAVDSSFFKLFSFELLAGDPGAVLSEPGSIVISTEMAKKYFGNEEPVGKELQVNTNEVFRITGVMKKMPLNSTINQDFLIPFDYMKKSNWYSETWSNNAISTYVILKENSDLSQVNKKLTGIADERNPDSETDFVLTPYTRLHLHAHWGYGNKPGAILNIWIFTFIAVLVLIIACINFMNLSTARSASRAKEIGLRKVAGAHRKNLITQFFSESLLTSFLAMIIALIMVILLLAPFNLISGKEFSLVKLLTPGFVAGLLIISFTTGILSGLYPAMILSRFRPLTTLKGTYSSGPGGGKFRRITVATQFALSIILVSGTLVLYRQLHHMQKQNLGYDQENLLFIPLRGDLKNSYPLIKEQLLHETVIKYISASVDPPQGFGSSSSNASWEGKPADMNVLISMTGVDYDYVEAMGITMKSGRTFSKDFAVDAAHDTIANFLINEQMEKIMGIENVVGAKLQFGSSGTIIGVMKDFNFQSLHNKIEPLIIWNWGSNFNNYMYIRLNPGNLQSSVKQIQRAWERTLPNIPFEYHFVETEFDNLYRTEMRTGTLMNYFAVLAVLIACIGLFGLATFSVEQRTREMSIRKALGASALSIARIFTSEIMMLLLVATVIAVPIAWFLMSRFLQNYSYHTKLSLWIFVASALLTMVVAMLTISYQTVRILLTNPAESLKTE